jgi:hypothetical protein
MILLDIDDELFGLMRRATDVFGVAVAGAAVTRVESALAGEPASNLPEMFARAYQDALKTEFQRLLRPA